MNVKKLKLFLLLLLCGWGSIYAQQKTVRGTVTDQEGLPLPGVNIIIVGTSSGTQTDFDGNYQISAQVGQTLLFTYLGQKDTRITVDQRNVINIAMEKSAESLDEVIVVAYGTSKKEAVTGAITQISAASIEDRPISNISTAIEGASAGVLVTSGGGQPGSGQRIRIRGFNSFGASNAPLYVVDGIPITGNLSNINPNDIENITILKDAGSTALYGNRGANGVVMVTTKRGKSEGGQVTVDISTGFVDRSIPEYKRLNAQQYYPIMWEAFRNSNAIPGVDSAAEVTAANTAATNGIFNALGYNPFNVPNNQIVVNGQLTSSELKYNDFDWLGAVTRTGIRKNADLNYSGKTENMDYYASLGYLKEDGYLINSDYERISGRVNVNFQAKDWLKLGANIAGTKSKGNQSNIGNSNSFRNPFRFTREMGPIYPIHAYDQDTGSPILDDNGNKIFDLNDNRPSGASTGRHVVAERMFDIDFDEITAINLKTYADIQITEDLSFRTNLSYEEEDFYNSFFWNTLIGDGAPDGLAYKQFYRERLIGFNQLINYNKSFGDHNLEVLLGHESQELQYDDLNGTRTKQVIPGNIELVNFVTTTDLTSQQDRRTDESFFSRVNYNYANKYFLSASFRRDGSSKFNKDFRWGNFWSVGASWNLDREEFIQNSDWIDQLKLRASYGEVGNNAGLDFYAHIPRFELNNNNQSEPGIQRASLGAPNLKWETTASFDLALEFSFFNKLRGTVEYYNKESVDLIFSTPVAFSDGADDKDQNIGTLVNKGFELSLDTDIINTENFSWKFGVTAATLTNEFTKLPQDEVTNGTKKFTVGKGLFDYWIRDWYGVDPADGSGLFVAEDETATGVRTINGVAVTPFSNNAKRHYAGSVIGDLFGSITNTFEYKGFALTTLFTYQIGGKNLDFNYAGIMSAGEYGTAKHVDILNRWQQPGDVTDVPRMDDTLATQWGATSDRWLVDASYFNLRQIGLSYRFNNEVAERIGIAGLKLYANAENVFAITARKGMNLQQEFSGNTSNVYTPSRVVSFGLNVKL